MSFSQLITLIEVRNGRERRAYEAAQAEAGDGDVLPPPPRNLQDPENLPRVSEITRLFGGM